MTRKDSERHIQIFNTIAFLYGRFYQTQKRRYGEVIDKMRPALDLPSYPDVLDVGCGTGALASALHDRGIKVTGVEPASKMLAFAVRQPGNEEIRFVQGNVLDGLPFEDKAFSVAIASYVAHGLDREDRIKMYREMSRVTRDIIIIYDYNEKRSVLISLAEWMERGDYFRFIHDAKDELKTVFGSVKTINAGPHAAWYIVLPDALSAAIQSGDSVFKIKVCETGEVRLKQ